MIRIGIISFAHMHANGYAAAIQVLQREGRAQLAGIADPDGDRLRGKAAEFSVTRIWSNYRDMINSREIDAVVIASENVRHRDEVCDAAAAGIHVLCEKPVGINRDDLTIMASALRNAKIPIVFQTAFVCRYSASVIEAKVALVSGKLGTIKAISATNHGRYPGGWFGDKQQSGGGAIIDHTVHAADVIRFLTGDEFCSVRAFQGVNIRADVQIEDNALIYAKLHKTEIPVSIDCSWSRHDSWPTWGDLTLNLYCEEGVIKIDAFRPNIQVASVSGLEWHGLGEDLNEKLMRSFCRSIQEHRSEAPRNGDPASALARDLRAGFDDGAKATEVALLAYESLSKDSHAILAVPAH